MVKLKKFFFLLGKKKSLILLLIFIFNCMVSFLDFFSIALIPLFFIIVFQGKDLLPDIPYLTDLMLNFSLFEISNSNILDLSFLMLTVFFFKGVVTFSVLSFESLFYEDTTNNVFKKIFKQIVHKDFYSYKKMNKFQIINSLSVELYNFKDLILDINNLFKDTILLIVIASFLLWFNPELVVIFTSLLFFFMIIIFFTKNLGIKGKQVIEYRSSFQGNLKELFSIINLIKLFKLENYFLNEAGNKQKKIEALLRYSKIISHVPRVIYEFISVLCMLFIINYLLLRGITLENVLSQSIVLSVFLIRIIPLFRTLNKNYYQFKFRANIIDFLYANFQISNKYNNKESNNNDNTFKNNIENFSKLQFKNLSFAYDKNKKILDNINLELNIGDVIGIKGSSGNGKSTLSNIMCGLLSPSTGELIIDGEEFHFSQLRDISSVVPQSTYLLDGTIKKNILLDLEKKINNLNYNKCYSNVLRNVDLEKTLSELTNYDQTLLSDNGSNISGGQKQRISIARTLIRDERKLIIFDESFSSLDLNSVKTILLNLKKYYKNKILIIISHKEEHFCTCNKVYNLSDGQLN